MTELMLIVLLLLQSPVTAVILTPVIRQWWTDRKKVRVYIDPWSNLMVNPKTHPGSYYEKLIERAELPRYGPVPPAGGIKP